MMRLMTLAGSIVPHARICCSHFDNTPKISRRNRYALAALILAGGCFAPSTARAQVNYVARFVMEKQKFIVGEPIFCNFVIKNTGARTFAFRYRSPDRSLNVALENEPHFKVTDEKNRALPDPAPHPCGGAKGSAVYGSVTLPPGQTHTERWLLNQWARFSHPGKYAVRAQRRLPLFTAEKGEPDFSPGPIGYAGAINDLQLEVVAGSKTDLRSALEPYLKRLDAPAPADVAEAVLVVTELPQPYCLEKLLALAQASPDEHRWDPSQALNGLARLGTPAAWEAIAQIARGEKSATPTNSKPAGSSKDDALRAYAILLLAEHGKASSIPTIVDIVNLSSGVLRGDALRALGFFHNAHATDVLFQNLRAKDSADRINAILGLKNLNSKDAVFALIDMLLDPDAEVRQVAQFALQGLTGQKFELSPNAGKDESERVAKQWRQWWQEHAATFTPVPLPICKEW